MWFQGVSTSDKTHFNERTGIPQDAVLSNTANLIKLHFAIFLCQQVFQTLFKLALMLLMISVEKRGTKSQKPLYLFFQ